MACTCSGDKCKQVSWDSFQWGHFGSIIFHILIALFVTYTGIKLEKRNEKKESVLIFNKSISVSFTGKILKWVGFVFLIVSLLSLWPIFTTKYDSYCIE